MIRNWTRRRLIGVIAATVLITAVAGSVALRAAKRGSEGKDAKLPPVALEFSPADLTRVEPAKLSRWLPVSGPVQPLHQATVKAKVSGDVRSVVFREGEVVRAGDVLARIDTADLEAKLVDRQGALEAARAQLAMAEKTSASNHALLKQNFISQNAFDNSESSYRVSEAVVKSAEAQVRIAQNALADAVATAPLSGIVAKRHVQPGEKVAFDSPLITLVDLREMELQAVVPAVDVPELATGMAVELSIEGFGDRRFAGRVERINPAAEPGSRAILVYVGIPNRDYRLRGGMYATGRIAIASAPAVPTLPVAAVRTEGAQSFVWTIEAGKLARRSVVVGRRDEESGRVEIRNTLPPDVPIIAARFDNLKEGATALVRAEAASEVKPG